MFPIRVKGGRPWLALSCFPPGRPWLALSCFPPAFETVGVLLEVAMWDIGMTPFLFNLKSSNLFANGVASSIEM